jgi:hypothetical protein
MPPHSEPVRPEEAPFSTSHRRDIQVRFISPSQNYVSEPGFQQTNGAPRRNGSYAKGRRGSLSERLEGFPGGHPAARTESTGSSVESSVLSSTTTRPGGTGGINEEDEARNRPAQVSSRI